jgi:hypothetical protein
MIISDDAGLWSSYKSSCGRKMRAERFGVHCGYCFDWVQIMGK